MKLLVVSSWFPFPASNGSKLRALNLLKSLSERHDVTLLTFAEAGEEQHVDDLKPLCASVQVVSGNPFKAGSSLGVRPLFSRLPRSYAATYSPEMQGLVDRALPRQDAAVALQVGAALYLAGTPAVPRVLDEVEAGVLKDQHQREVHPVARVRKGLTWLKFSRFVRGLVSSFDRTTVVSDVERSYLEDMGCDLRRVRVVPNGVDRDHLSFAETRKPEQVIYPGAVTFSANLDAVQYFVHEVLPRIRRAKPDVRFLVTGGTGDVDVGGLASQGLVTFTGHVPDVRALIARSAACVVPLRIGGGTRLKILEAMALGTPVVSTTKGAEGLAVAHDEHVLLADTPDDFAACVVRLLDDPELGDRLVSRGRGLVRSSYTWDRIGQQFGAVLDEAVAARPIGRSASSRKGATYNAAGV
jgi:glycosyltransferase involved in cell wall biosynthesis